MRPRLSSLQVIGRWVVPRRYLATHVSTLDANLRPNIVTGDVPGPKGKEASSGIGSFQDQRTHVLVCGESSLHDQLTYAQY